MSEPKYQRVTKQMLEAAQRTAAGESVEEIAAHFGKTVETVRRWLKLPDVQRLYKELKDSKNLAVVARAKEVLIKQMDDSNPWVASQAARELLRLYEQDANGAQDKKIQITFTGGMPDVGMPEPTGDDE